MTILDLAFSALHLFPAPGIVNYPEAINIYRELQVPAYKTVARDELRAINEIRVRNGLPASMSAANHKENPMYIKPVKRSLLSMPRWQAIGVGLFLILAFGIMSHFDAQDEQAQHEHYCEMVAIWKADAARGVPANDRAGWPPFNGECK